MVVYTLKERWEILRHYFENHGNVAECVRKLRTAMGRKKAPNEAYVRYFAKKVRETGLLIDKPTRDRPKTVRTPENIAAVAESVRESPGTSVHRRSQQLDISETSLRRILRKDLGMTPYKVQLVQQLKQTDHPMRFRFASWAWDRLEEDEDFYRKIIFSDEAHFHLGGYVNKQNCRIWAQKTRTHSKKSRCIHNESLFGADFGREASLVHLRGVAVTVNGERYRAMLNEFLFREIEEEDIGGIWFQQDGATCHTANATINLLRTDPYSVKLYGGPCRMRFKFF